MGEEKKPWSGPDGEQRARREALDWSLRRLMREAGVSTNTLARIEKGGSTRRRVRKMVEEALERGERPGAAERMADLLWELRILRTDLRVNQDRVAGMIEEQWALVKAIGPVFERLVHDALAERARR